MKKYRIFVSLLLLSSASVLAQKTDTIFVSTMNDVPKEQLKTDKKGRTYYRDDELQATVYLEENGDRLIDMDELKLTANVRFNNELDKRYYAFLNKKLRRVYPMFVQALEQYRMLQDELQRVPENKRRSYAKRRQAELADQYEAQLKDLTTTEGQVFAKLMNRATGKTVYNLIKDLRGGWSAFWWNLKGNVADVPLKKPYNPHFNRDDKYLEALLQSSWNHGYLKPYPGYQNFTYKTTRD